MKRFLKGLGIALGLVAVGVVSALAVIALLLRQEEVKVPDLTGQDIVTAVEVLSQAGLQLKIDRREPHQTVTRDAVISQTPLPGASIKKGRPVRVVVSQGPSELQVPNVVGEHFRKADVLIRQAGFLPAGVARVATAEIPRDIVIAQDPPPGTQLDKGGSISLLVSAGIKTRRYVMPRLVGKRATEALRTVERMGLQHRVSSAPAEGQQTPPDRVVLRQKPAAGSPVASDMTVELVVSR
jgi:serine/threonine-protein kinase